MNGIDRSTARVVLAPAIAAVLLVGCSPQPPTLAPEPGGPGSDGSSIQKACVVGTWALDLANWSSDLDHEVLTDPRAPGAPTIDYTGIPSVGMSCTEHELTLVMPGAPLTTTWYR